MNPLRSLSLAEEILLLALRDREGTWVACGHLSHALGGAMLAELLLAGRIRQGEKDRKRRVEILDARPVGDLLLDEGLHLMASARRPASLATWVDRLGRLSRLKHRIAEGLCQRGVLRLGQKEILLLFRKRIYPEVDPQPERELRDRLGAVLAAGTREVELRTRLLVSLLNGARLLGLAVSRKELKSCRNQIKALVAGEPLGQAVAEAVQAAEALAACCVVVAAAS
jgi:golgi phosphoprotein 3